MARLSRGIMCCILLTLFVCAGAQEAADSWYYDQPIRRIEFEGLKNVKSVDMNAVTRPFLGQPFSDAVYAELLSGILALEYFEPDSIEARVLPYDEMRASVRLIFTVTERPIVARLTFVGNREIRTVELKEHVSIKERDIFIQSRVLLDERALREHYLKNGFTGVAVSSRTVELPNGVEVVFVINEGASTVVTSIRFQGNNVVTGRRLRGLLETKERGFLRKGAFQESSLEQDKQAIATYYLDRGYADVSVGDVMREVSFNEKEGRNEVTLTFIIHEGFQYNYGGVTITGNKLFSTAQLLNLIRLKEGTLFNFTRFQEGLAAIADLYYENGYTSNEFAPEMAKDVEKRLVTATLSIVEYPRSHIEHIIVRGNTKTKPHVIMRELQLEPGDIFSKAKMQNGLRNLLNLQYFSNIVPDIVRGSEDNLVDVIINVQEQSTTSVEFGLTFTGVSAPDEFPVSLFLKFQDSNIFGSGKTVSADGTLSPSQQSIALGYSDSWFFGLPFSLSLSADVAHHDYTALQRVYFPNAVTSTVNYMNYEQWSFTLSAGVGHRWFPAFAILSVSGGVTSSLLRNFYDASLFEPVDDTIADYEGQWGLRDTLWASVSLDNRDVNYDPSKGWFVSERLSWTGLLPRPVETEFFLRSDTKAELYFPLVNWAVTESWSFKLIMMAYSGLSFQFPYNDAIGRSSMLYIDGMFNGRGWMSYAYDIRGKAMWSNSVELRMPLLPGIISFDLFFDAAVIKGEPGQFFGALSGDDFYFSFGPGLRFALPQFPLRLLLSFPFKTVDGQVRWLSTSSKLDANQPEVQFVLSFNIVNR